MIRSEDGETLARVSDRQWGWVTGERGQKQALRILSHRAGVWCSLHGDQCQDWHECGVGLSGNCQVRAEQGKGA